MGSTTGSQEDTALPRFCEWSTRLVGDVGKARNGLIYARETDHVRARDVQAVRIPLLALPAWMRRAFMWRGLGFAPAPGGGRA